jgi:hypothetical protein
LSTQYCKRLTGIFHLLKKYVKKFPGIRIRTASLAWAPVQEAALPGIVGHDRYLCLALGNVN